MTDPEAGINFDARKRHSFPRQYDSEKNENRDFCKSPAGNDFQGQISSTARIHQARNVQVDIGSKCTVYHAQSSQNLEQMAASPTSPTSPSPMPPRSEADGEGVDEEEVDLESEDTNGNNDIVPFNFQDQFEANVVVNNPVEVALYMGDKNAMPSDVKFFYSHCPMIKISDTMILQLIRENKTEELRKLMQIALESYEKSRQKQREQNQQFQKDGPASGFPRKRSIAKRQVNNAPRTEVKLTHDSIQINFNDNCTSQSHSLKDMKRSTKFCSKLFCGYEHVGRTLMTFVILGLTFAVIYLLIYLHGENYFTPSKNKIAPF